MSLASRSTPALVNSISANVFSASETASEATFAEIEFTDSGVDLEANAMARPTSTWTYMVHDNPMAAGGNVFSGMMSTFR